MPKRPQPDGPSWSELSEWFIMYDEAASLELLDRFEAALEAVAGELFSTRDASSRFVAYAMIELRHELSWRGPTLSPVLDPRADLLIDWGEVREFDTQPKHLYTWARRVLRLMEDRLGRLEKGGLPATTYSGRARNQVRGDQERRRPDLGNASGASSWSSSHAEGGAALPQWSAPIWLLCILVIFNKARDRKRTALELELCQPLVALNDRLDATVEPEARLDIERQMGELFGTLQEAVLSQPELHEEVQLLNPALVELYEFGLSAVPPEAWPLVLAPTEMAGRVVASARVATWMTWHALALRAEQYAGRSRIRRADGSIRGGASGRLNAGRDHRPDCAAFLARSGYSGGDPTKVYNCVTAYLTMLNPPINAAFIAASSELEER